MSDQGPGYNLVVPFTVCESNGGWLDDHAFTLGVRYGMIRCYLSTDHPDTWCTYETPELRSQLDLLALELGYVLSIEPYDEDWEMVSFKKGENV